MTISRRQFVRQATTVAAGLSLSPELFASGGAKKGLEISLAQWSFHKALFAKKFDNLDFPAKAKKDFGIGAVEYVNQFFKDKAKDSAYLKDLLSRAKDNGVKNHLIMIDGEGGLGELDKKVRMQAVENHYKWVDAAKALECATIRVNAHGTGDAAEVHKAAVEGLSSLGEYARKVGINVIVENHGGHSSHGGWISGVMKDIGKKNIGTLPDFGNFCLKRGEGYSCLEEYDRYKGTKEMMPFAKGVSAKAYNFDDAGNCLETDYVKMMQILKAAGFEGYIGIEYEGDGLTEEEGIKKTRDLLLRTAAQVGYAIK
ncbi:MAG TPA: sugar phosphate isomerase/epimerase family protein [Flavisolibacter sp.]|jgi:sugar phosphate isomerase/epimerase|nr:sugar phosphate isomerase/epimerase family protein [Flavisolibacter sp.]